MRWPPVKAWTSTTLRGGFRHFVAINYGGTDKDRWVLMISVLDGKSRMIIPWTDMKDSDKWVSGWMSLSRDEANSRDSFSVLMQNESDAYCLHPSRDSGLLIPSDIRAIRAWD